MLVAPENSSLFVADCPLEFQPFLLLVAPENSSLFSAGYPWEFSLFSGCPCEFQPFFCWLPLRIPAFFSAGCPWEFQPFLLLVVPENSSLSLLVTLENISLFSGCPCEFQPFLLLVAPENFSLFSAGCPWQLRVYKAWKPAWTRWGVLTRSVYSTYIPYISVSLSTGRDSYTSGLNRTRFPVNLFLAASNDWTFRNLDIGDIPWAFPLSTSYVQCTLCEYKLIYYLQGYFKNLLLDWNLTR